MLETYLIRLEQLLLVFFSSTNSILLQFQEVQAKETQGAQETE